MSYQEDFSYLKILLKFDNIPSLKRIEKLIPKNLVNIQEDTVLKDQEVVFTFRVPKTVLYSTSGSYPEKKIYILLKETILSEDVSLFLDNVYKEYVVNESQNLEGYFKLQRVLGASFFKGVEAFGKEHSTFASDSVSVGFEIKKPNQEKINNEWISFQSKLNRFVGIE